MEEAYLLRRGLSSACMSEKDDRSWDVGGLALPNTLAD
jgi:hypothetical protein